MGGGKAGAVEQQHLTTVNVLIRRRRKGSQSVWDVHRALGHADEVRQLRSAKDGVQEGGGEQLELTEAMTLGLGAFSRVSLVTDEATGIPYALKEMFKPTVLPCAQHILREQAITRALDSPFCARQRACFQDEQHLYILFDVMAGGTLMDVLVAEARLVRQRAPHGVWGAVAPCLAPEAKMLRGIGEDLARYYVGSVVLALEHLHAKHIVYRDLKPENILVDEGGRVRLGDFGFAKVLEKGGRTSTFCGTHVAPETVLGHAYTLSVDWWGLGVLMYMLLTGRQPFSAPGRGGAVSDAEDKAEGSRGRGDGSRGRGEGHREKGDASRAKVVMDRIADPAFQIAMPPYLSPAAKDLLRRLLERCPDKRVPGGAAELKGHKWFKGAGGASGLRFCWADLASGRLPPPRKPKQSDSSARLKEMLQADRRGAGAGPQQQQQQQQQLPLAQQQQCDAAFADF